MLKHLASALGIVALTAACSHPPPPKPPEPPPPPPVEVKAPEPPPPPAPAYIEISSKVEFITGKADLRNDSRKVLDEVVDKMKSNAQIHLVEIGGHTDDRGLAAQNLDLSQRRADAVKDYLVKQGVESGRLETHGYGQERPIASNATAEGREQNRRVEFKIEKQDGKPDSGG